MTYTTEMPINMLTSREEDEHKKKISRLPKSIRLPNGQKITLR
jgi:hypothetical protein